MPTFASVFLPLNTLHSKCVVNITLTMSAFEVFSRPGYNWVFIEEVSDAIHFDVENLTPISLRKLIGADEIIDIKISRDI